ncbi:hypothetical protein SAMN04487948_12573 [Halogranum amylolyticum]|uniref:Transferase hexapeptide (Six repeat-containing protein) n=1 Tax=Halogranum amylolyticum TaxID=660520 RepID=A0A1H8W980_9EURY|nr:hypothetical protein [Halogranum amylolyticum]SEP24204.1 hypothetical protein SAMN04487948_12573 [Halogranum amylolyticum]
MQSAVRHGATVKSNGIVAAGAIVLQSPTDPSGHVAYGARAETRPLTDDQRDEVVRVHEHYVELGRQYREVGRFE